MTEILESSNVTYRVYDYDQVVITVNSMNYTLIMLFKL